MWTTTDYDDAAKKLSTDFMSAGGATSINDLATKLASDAHLTPEGIRTMVRLANVAVFEQQFSKRAEAKAPDRMIEFEVGDPEVVINRLYANEKTACVSTLSTAKIHNREMDLYGDIDRPAELEKVAFAVEGQVVGVEETAYNPAEMKLLFKRAEDKMRDTLYQAKVQWQEATEKVARLVVAKDGRVSNRITFEKDAVAILGENVVPELLQVCSLTKTSKDPLALFGGEKIAAVTDNHVAVSMKSTDPVVGLLKEAMAAREQYVQSVASMKWLANTKTRIG